MHDRKTDTGDHVFLGRQTFHLESSFKGGSVEETLMMYMFSPYSKFNLLFLSLCVYLYKNCPQFFSHWESAEPVFCSEASVVFLAKTKKKAWLSVIWWENSNLLCVENIYTSISSMCIGPPLSVRFLD